MLLDADNSLEHEALEVVFQSIENEKCSLVLFSYTEIWQSNKQSTEYIPSVSAEEIKSKSFKLFLMNRKGFISVPWAYIYDRSFVIEKSIRFTEGIYFEDLEFVWVNRVAKY